MMPTGDIYGGLRQLEGLLRVLRYPGEADFSGLSKGDPAAFLPILSFAMTSFSSPVAEHLVTAGFELTGKTDLRFTDTLYKALRDVFDYKLVLTKQQFLQWGFSQRKLALTCDIINLVLEKHSQLKKPKLRCPAPRKGGSAAARPTETRLTTPFVVSHLETQPCFGTNSCGEVSSMAGNVASHAGVSSSASFHNEILELSEEEEAKSSHVEQRLSGLEAQVEALAAALTKLTRLEKLLDHLEREPRPEKAGEDIISVSRESWENLQSRVLLLETKLELSRPQNAESAQSPRVNRSSSTGSTGDSSKDTEDRLQRISNMLKNTFSLLEDTEPLH